MADPIVTEAEEHLEEKREDVKEAEEKVEDAETPAEKAEAEAELARAKEEEENARRMLKVAVKEAMDEWHEEHKAVEEVNEPPATPGDKDEEMPEGESPAEEVTSPAEEQPEERSRWFGT
jgi:vacuolar-type H+-ATPase subunit E/Vma4